MTNLLSVEQLRARTNAPVLLHASMGPKPPSEVIPGAHVADLDGDFSDLSKPLPHTVPAEIQRVFERYGVSDDTDVVVYDSDGATAPRVWWLARVAGLDNVSILDGGARAWVAAGGELVAPAELPEPGTITATPRWNLLVDANHVASLIDDHSDTSIVDARSHDRFTGDVDEPRPGLRSGHIPGSTNVPYTEVYNADGTFKTAEELDPVLPNGPMVFSCGSGVTACVLAFAATQAGREDVAVYEGSWSEWGRPDSGLPVATGEGK